LPRLRSHCTGSFQAQWLQASILFELLSEKQNTITMTWKRMQLGWWAGSHARSAPTVQDWQPKPSRPGSRAARQLLQHCLNTAQQGPRRQLEQRFAVAYVRLTAGASGRLCARQESKGSRTEAEQRGKGFLRGKSFCSKGRQWRREKKRRQRQELSLLPLPYLI